MLAICGIGYLGGSFFTQLGPTVLEAMVCSVWRCCSTRLVLLALYSFIGGAVAYDHGGALLGCLRLVPRLVAAIVIRYFHLCLLHPGRQVHRL